MSEVSEVSEEHPFRTLQLRQRGREAYVGSSHRDLIVWQRAKSLASAIYKLTEGFPKEEMYGLISQLRRASVSVSSNIAEGQGRLTRGEFIQFLGHARGSLLEVDTQLEIALDLGFATKEQVLPVQNATSEVLFLLNRLISSLRPRAVSNKRTSDTSETSGTSETE